MVAWLITLTGSPMTVPPKVNPTRWSIKHRVNLQKRYLLTSTKREDGNSQAARAEAAEWHTLGVKFVLDSGHDNHSVDVRWGKWVDQGRSMWIAALKYAISIYRHPIASALLSKHLSVRLDEQILTRAWSVVSEKLPRFS